MTRTIRRIHPTLKVTVLVALLAFVAGAEVQCPGAVEARPSLDGLQQQIDDLELLAAPHIGEVRLLAGTTLPAGWLLCDGSLLTVAGNEGLFAEIGTAFGGIGVTHFALPDLKGRVPMGAGAGIGLTNRLVGQKPGAETVILDVTQLPSHDHTLRATNSSATQTQPSGNSLATAATSQYLNAFPSVVMGAFSIGQSGSNAPHANVQPSTVLDFIIYAGE